MRSAEETREGFVGDRTRAFGKHDATACDSVQADDDARDAVLHAKAMRRNRNRNLDLSTILYVRLLPPRQETT